MQDAIRLLLLKESNSGNINALEHMLGRRGFVFDSVVWGIVPDQPSKRRECDLVLIAADDWPNAGMPMVDWCKGWGGRFSWCSASNLFILKLKFDILPGCSYGNQ